MTIGKRISVGLLGLAFGLTCVGTAGAQPIINSSTITSPDSSTKVGIDSTVTVEVSVFQSSADADLQVLAWLVSGGAEARAFDVLFDATEFEQPGR